MGTSEIQITTHAVDYEEVARFQKRAFTSATPDPRIAALQTPEYYDWKYDAPAGRARIGRIVEDGATISFVAAVPATICQGKETIAAWQLCDIATDPRSRRRGHFRRLLAAMMSSLPEQALVYCFPNRRSLPVLADSGFSTAGELRFWAAPILAPPLGLVSYTIGTSAATLGQPLGGAVAQHTGWATRIDQAYLDWRFVRRPGVRYVRLTVHGNDQTGEAFVRSAWVARKLVVVLMLVRGHASTIRLLLRAVANYAATQGAWAVLYPASDWRGSLRPFFVPVPRLLMPRSFPIVVRPCGRQRLSFSGSDWDVL